MGYNITRPWPAAMPGQPVANRCAPYHSQADFVPVIPVNTAMLDGTLEAAVTSAPPPYQQVLSSAVSICTFTGMCRRVIQTSDSAQH